MKKLLPVLALSFACMHLLPSAGYAQDVKVTITPRPARTGTSAQTTKPKPKPAVTKTSKTVKPPVKKAATPAKKPAAPAPAVKKAAVPATAGLKLAAEFEGGRLYKAGRFNVLELRGSFRQMGRQYGALLKDDLNRCYTDMVTETFIKKDRNSPETLQKVADSFYSRLPQRLRSMMEGMSETSGIPLEKHKVLAIADALGEIMGLEGRLGGGCSGIAAWNEYTKGGPLVFGRNYDYPPSFMPFSKYLVCAVYNPTDGSVPTANIHYAGAVYTQNGMNSKGIFLELNDDITTALATRRDRTPAPAQLLAFLLDSSGMDQMDAAFKSALPDWACIIQVADAAAAHSYEWTLSGVKRVDGNPRGLLVATNHLVDPSWGMWPPPVGDSTLRRKNLLALGEKYKGSFSAATMMKVLDTKIQNGGATESSPEDATIYQIVALPASLRWWLKAEGFQNWTEIDLKPLFRK